MAKQPRRRGERLKRIRQAHKHIDSMLKALFDGNMNSVESVTFPIEEIMNIKDSLNYLVRLARKGAK